MIASKQVMLLMAALLLAPLALVAVYVLRQRSFIYYPSKYPPAVVQGALSQGITLIEFQTSQAKQTAFLFTLSPADRPPRRLWLLFGGNAMLALDWLDLLRGYPDRSTGFLLVDYPGYGLCQGSPNPARIRESAETAFRALQAQTHWRFAPESFGVVGWWLGAAVALQFAEGHPVGRVILVAPFTTLDAMAARVLGFPPGPLLRHHFDNLGTLRRLLARKPAPKVTVIHGRADAVVPIAMGRALARLDPQRVRFVEVAGAGHNDAFERAQPEIFAEMAGP